MMNREGLLSSLKGLSKGIYSREELLPEMEQLEREMAQIVFEDESIEGMHLSDIMDQMNVMNDLSVGVSDEYR
mgnify:CR=1 FL=1